MSPALRRGGTFLLVGLLNTGFGYVSYAALVLLGLPLWLAVACNIVIGLLFNFLSYGRLVFANTSMRALPRFVLLYAVMGFLDHELLQVLTQNGVGPLIAQALLLPPLAIAIYFGMKLFVFRGEIAARPDTSEMVK